MPIVLYPAGIGIGQGDPGGIQFGSGLAVPGGVESEFEFNGIFMNIRNWWDTFIVTEIDGLDDADIRDAREVNPGYHGETAFDSYYSGRTITITGKIRAYTLNKLRDMEQALRAAFGDLQEHPLVIRSGTPARSVQIMCKKYQKVSIKEAQTDFRHVRDFQVSLRASDPFFLSYLENYAPIAAVPGTATIANKGNFPARPRFTIIGPVVDPQITNVTTGESVLLNATLSSGDIWQLDTLKRTLIDQDGNNQFGSLDITSDWISLDGGDNSIQFVGGGIVDGVSSLQIYWHDTWI